MSFPRGCSGRRKQIEQAQHFDPIGGLTAAIAILDGGTQMHGIEQPDNDKEHQYGKR